MLRKQIQHLFQYMSLNDRLKYVNNYIIKSFQTRPVRNQANFIISNNPSTHSTAAPARQKTSTKQKQSKSQLVGTTEKVCRYDGFATLT